MCDQKLLVPIPDLLTIRDFDPTHPEFGINDAGERCLNLDACIVPAVQALWAAGIVTEACCCGHGEAWGVITVQRQEDPSLRGAVLLRREEYNDLTAAQATIAQLEAQVAALQADRDAWRKEREDVANLLYSQEGRLGALTEQLAARDAEVERIKAWSALWKGAAKRHRRASLMNADTVIEYRFEMQRLKAELKDMKQLAARDAQVAELTAALSMAAGEMVYQDTDLDWCRICDQTAPTDQRIDHAPDCPFALLARTPAAPQGETVRADG